MSYTRERQTEIRALCHYLGVQYDPAIRAVWSSNGDTILALSLPGAIKEIKVVARVVVDAPRPAFHTRVSDYSNMGGACFECSLRAGRASQKGRVGYRVCDACEAAETAAVEAMKKSHADWWAKTFTEEQLDSYMPLAPAINGPATCIRCNLVNEHADPSPGYVCYECRR